VCSCFGVQAAAIAAHLGTVDGAPEERLASLQSTLRCGTNCGSCVPELKRMVRAAPAAQRMSS
jgi:assimilatory nitrate reductase catalytic subunit